MLPHMPQSNQRGIETLLAMMAPAHLGRPQSNQRGIETSMISLTVSWMRSASIEPAWD